MFGMDGLQRQIADRQPVAGPHLVDRAAGYLGYDAPKTDRDDERRLARQGPQGLEVQMVQVTVADKDRGQVHERFGGHGRHLTPDG